MRHLPRRLSAFGDLGFDRLGLLRHLDHVFRHVGERCGDVTAFSETA
jgi:hypothetical protein